MYLIKTGLFTDTDQQGTHSCTTEYLKARQRSALTTIGTRQTKIMLTSSIKADVRTRSEVR